MEKNLTGGSATFRDHAQIRIIGNSKDVKKAETSLKTIQDLKNLPEPKARLEIQRLIDSLNLKAHILFDGNSVWSKNRIISNLRRIIKHGALYDEKSPGERSLILSDYFYDFLSLDCGSIAHYNKWGWVDVYPTVEDLRQFFKRNEYGQSVRDNIPGWMTDAKCIVEEIDTLLGTGA